MELQYELTADDYRAHTRHSMRNMKRIQTPWQAQVLSMALGVLFAIALILTRPHAMVFRDMAGVAAALVLMTLVYAYSARLKVRRYQETIYREGPSVITMSLVLLPTGIEFRSSLGSCVNLWHAFRDIEHGDQHLFIPMGIASVNIIPKRAFRDEQHMHAFLDELHRLKTEAAGAASAASIANEPAGPSPQ